MPIYEVSIAGLGAQPDREAPCATQAAGEAVEEAVGDLHNAPEIWEEGTQVVGRWAVTTREIRPGSTPETHVVERVAQVRVEVAWRVR